MQTNTLLRRVGAMFAFIALLTMMSLPVIAKGKPVVAIIKAEWCSACQKLDPTMMELIKQYGDRLDFVVLDVSNEEKLAEASTTAKKYGLSNFLKENQKNTSTVAVFSGKKVLFQTVKNFDRDAYVKAFDEALEEWCYCLGLRQFCGAYLLRPDRSGARAFWEQAASFPQVWRKPCSVPPNCFCKRIT